VFLLYKTDQIRKEVIGKKMIGSRDTWEQENMWRRFRTIFWWV